MPNSTVRLRKQAESLRAVADGDARPFARGHISDVSGKSLICGISSPAVWAPALLLLGLTVVFRLTDADARISGLFCAGNALGDSAGATWPLRDVQPWIGLYHWGVYPAWILGSGGLAVWLAGFIWKQWRPWQASGLFYVLLLLIGPGILVNLVFKPCWNRPRPHATTLFGGEREFVPVLSIGSNESAASFPSGHASMGFYLMAPAFVYYRGRPKLALAFVLLGLFGGLTIGLARVVAGSHFSSDVVWAGGIVYFTALMLAVPFRFGQPSSPA